MAKRKMKPGGGKAKGAQGELELSHYLTERGWVSRRGQQFSGAGDSPDVVSTLPFHIEVKRTEKTDLYAWLAQAKRDSKGKKMPVVIHRKNGKDWMAIMPLEDLLQFILETPA